MQMAMTASASPSTVIVIAGYALAAIGGTTT